MKKTIFFERQIPVPPPVATIVVEMTERQWEVLRFISGYEGTIANTIIDKFPKESIRNSIYLDDIKGTLSSIFNL